MDTVNYLLVNLHHDRACAVYGNNQDSAWYSWYFMGRFKGIAEPIKCTCDYPLIREKIIKYSDRLNEILDDIKTG